MSSKPHNVIHMESVAKFLKASQNVAKNLSTSSKTDVAKWGGDM